MSRFMGVRVEEQAFADVAAIKAMAADKGTRLKVSEIVEQALSLKRGAMQDEVRAQTVPSRRR